MNSKTTLERSIAAAMAERAAAGDTDEAVEQILSITRELRPAPRWLALLKEPPMRTTSHVASGSPPLRAAMILAVVGALLLTAGGAIIVGSALIRSTAPMLPAPYGPARNGSLLFERGDIYRADASGGQQTALITGEAAGLLPTYSRDGTRFAFFRYVSGGLEGRIYQLVIANADGTIVRELEHEIFDLPTAFDWSPDGTRIALINHSAGPPAILVLPVDGTPAQTFDLGTVVPSGAGDAWVAWRPPAGDELLFRGEETEAQPGRELGPGVFSIRLDTGDVTAVAPRNGIGVETGDPRFADPQISPDGTTITYWSWDVDRTGDDNGFARVLNIVTGDYRVVDAYGGSPSPISPDGKLIVGEGRGRLAIEPVDGSAPARPIGPRLGEARTVALSFSPDGAKVLLTLGSDVTRIIDVASGEVTRIAEPTGSRPSWQRLAP